MTPDLITSEMEPVPLDDAHKIVVGDAYNKGFTAGLKEARNILAESKDRAIAFDSIGRVIRSLSPPTTKER